MKKCKNCRIVSQQSEIESLQSQLAESQDRERESVECLTNHVHWNECCEFCKADCATAGLEDKMCQCGGFEYNPGWRGYDIPEKGSCVSNEY